MNNLNGVSKLVLMMALSTTFTAVSASAEATDDIEDVITVTATKTERSVLKHPLLLRSLSKKKLTDLSPFHLKTFLKARREYLFKVVRAVSPKSHQ